MTHPIGGGQPVVPPASACCYRHSDRATNVRCTRCDNPICPECMNAASVGFQCPSCVRDARSTARRPAGTFGGRVPTGTPVTTALIALNVLAFLATISRSGLIQGGTPTQRFVDFAQINGAVASNGDYYRIFTAMFLHFGLIHIGSNMFVLYLVGPQLERVLGWWRFLACYLIAGIGGGVATYAFSAEGNSSAGASGAIFGLFAVLVVVARTLNADIRGILGTIALNLVITFSVPGISVTDHIGGLVTGGVLGLIITRAPRRPALQATGLAGVLALLVLVALLRTAALT